MYTKLVKALEPFGFIMVIFSGLILAGRMEVSDRDIVGVITVFIGVALSLNHIVEQIKSPKQKG